MRLHNEVKNLASFFDYRALRFKEKADINWETEKHKAFYQGRAHTYEVCASALKELLKKRNK